MKIRQGDTELFHEKVARCEDVEELKEILNRDSDYYQDWKKLMNGVMEVNKLSYEKLGRLCNCSKNTVKRWCLEGKLPQNRETFIKISLGLGLDLEQTNDFLQRYGKYPKLYPKNMEDAIHIFVIHHPDYSRDPYEYYNDLKRKCLMELKNIQVRRKKAVKEELNTQYFFDELLSKKTQEDFEEFIISNADIFETSYRKLIQYLDMFILSKSGNVHEFVRNKELNPTFEKLLSLLRKKREVPNRTKLIALGIHLNMSLEQLNEMLSLAYMEPVCAKDRVECAIIYAVESAHLNNPELAYENAICLKNYVQNREIQVRCKQIIQEYMDTITYESIGDFKEYSNMEDEISEYLKWVLKEIALDSEEIYQLL